MQLTALIRCKALTLGALLMMSTGTIRADAIDDARRELQRYSGEHPVTVGQSPGYYYRCFDAICELRSHYVEGRETQIRRQITTGSAIVYETYRRQGESIRLVDAGVDTLPDDSYYQGVVSHFDHTAGAESAKKNCTTCDDDKVQFLQHQRDIREIAEHWVEPNKAYREGDFQVSPLGTLIHDNCFEEGRWQFDIMAAELHSVDKGMACLADGEEYYEKEQNLITSTKYALFPVLARYWDRTAWATTNAPFFRTSNDGKFQVTDFQQLRRVPFYAKNASEWTIRAVFDASLIEKIATTRASTVAMFAAIPA